MREDRPLAGPTVRGPRERSGDRAPAIESTEPVRIFVGEAVGRGG